MPVPSLRQRGANSGPALGGMGPRVGEAHAAWMSVQTGVGSAVVPAKTGPTPLLAPMSGWVPAVAGMARVDEAVP